MKSTILTLINQMTELKILNVLSEEIIEYFMGKKEQTIKILKELNTEDVKNAKNIKYLICFGKELLVLMEDIVEIVQNPNCENGEKKIVNTLTPICENTIATRFRYVSKASKRERNMGCEEMDIPEYRWNKGGVCQQIKGTKGNFHPTVKSLSLMRYLCILTKTPTGGIVLDPFAGSGSTLIAAKQTGRDYIGIEKEKEYAEIARARVAAAEKAVKQGEFGF
ncbi:MAG: site-specific DNA-methyltransferase [Candidatus Omnitrophica bacterium]|nr:site-specific DNA-methyltransferase [Candidatus Omnitrophota bacterium]